MGMWPVCLHRVPHSEGPSLCSKLCGCPLGIFHNFIFELMFCKWSPMGHAHEQRSMQFGWLQFLPPHLHVGLTMLPCTELRWVPNAGVSGDWEWVAGKLLCLWASRNNDSYERPFKPELASTAERRQWCPQKHERLGNPIIPFLTLATSLY